MIVSIYTSHQSAFLLTLDPGETQPQSVARQTAFRRLWLGAMLIIGGALSSVSSAQTYNFHHFGADDGLPQVQVFAIAQDAEGYLWVGTYSGLGRYNGRQFQNFSKLDGLGANLVSALAVGPEGHLWAGTGSGLCRFNADEEHFHCPQGEGLEQAHVNTLMTNDNALWAGTDRGLYRVQGDQISRIEDSASANIQSLAQDHTGSLWVGTADGLLRQGPASDKFQAVSLPNNSATSVTALHADGDHLWIGTSSGLYRHLDGGVQRLDDIPSDLANADISGIVSNDTGELWVASNQGVYWQRANGEQAFLDRSNGLTNEIAHTIFMDREGLVWIGHDDGLSKWIPSAFTGYLTSHGLIDNFVRSITEDNQGRLWLGTRSGVQIVAREDGDWNFDSARTLTVADGLLDDRVYAVAFPGPGQALIATDNGVARWREDEGIVEIITDADGLPTNNTQSVMVDHSGGVWIGTNLGTVFMEDGEIRPVDDPTLAGAYAFRIREDEAGRVWFGTRDNGLFVLANGKFTQFGAADGVTDETIWDLSPAGDNSMWIGSNGDGLFRVHADGSAEQLTEADGLSDNFVWQVLEDSRGHVWAYTNRGLSRYDGMEFRNFGRDDGLLHVEGGATGAWESHDGNLWFASADGLMRYDPEYIHSEMQPPHVVVERVTHEGRLVTEGETLPPGAGNMDIHYAAMSFRSEDALRYRYRLAGGDESWSEPMEYRPVTFGNLSGGEYVFEVQAQYGEGPWTVQPAQFAFSVRPHFWATAWFWALTIVLGGLLVWALVRLKLRASELRRRELEAQVIERTRDLEKANKKLEAASITDPLTGLHNRRFLMNQIIADIAQSRRAYVGDKEHPNRDIVFMMIDLDNFKQINDEHGHLVGDLVLRGYSDILRRQLRTSDYVVRWGGEEFLVVARQTEAKRLDVIAERMMTEARDAVFEVDGVKGGLRCTCSIGICHFPFVQSEPDAMNWEQIVDVADCAIYMAKRLGRNGWVAIHGTEKARVDDAQEFLRRLKSDLESLVAAGEIVIESSFPNPLDADN
ncbi:diguanylate cyclase [Wenzhouxiangella sp. XN201]|uniref:ligand-binding sensor domain-containing protein n=1 Tax=Wenzhouxiangella sp. XN201 TaxID=2710755 RepID=UPI0013C575B9|nr:ligand-binding sensor domain-containing diguanylate cyclase [Wenzhouxiangella sp. XN201]NEZ03215.1 diguanylate cyclase [Wenzhouxiangella sp. XN201]